MSIIGFPFFESQAQRIAQLLSGKRTLPSWDDMMQSIKEFYHSKDLAGISKKYTHFADFEALQRPHFTQMHADQPQVVAPQSL
ncbi:FAD/NAD(P)-binding domain containing protein [Parasponia andersonii]|uniref:FAD/NAD(P)-binding domain containing protein n=1 Tax=Parasponia andersonii TaxID=3476 RepID=A0A2P5D6J0_PARAD|nr:FAD/NAD(P)-binding domain containing protein [Parasponia andersonii]